MKQRDVLMLGFMLWSSVIGLGYAQEPVTGALEQREIQKLELTAGKSRVLDLPVAIGRPLVTRFDSTSAAEDLRPALPPYPPFSAYPSK